MDKQESIFVAGHKGLVGSAIVRALQAQGYQNLLLTSSKELDLRDQAQTFHFFQENQPKYVFLAAAKVGGIIANNTYRADFIYENLAIELNVIHAAHRFHTEKLLFLGSSCIYPKFAPQPLKESALLTGLLEPTNEPYAIAKIAGIKLCEAYMDQYGKRFISAMPTNMYGPNDNYHPENSHVIPGLIHRFHQAKINQLPQVVIWGTGSPLREFLYADDLAEACVYLMQHYEDREFINIGSGIEISILDLAKLIAKIVGYEGDIQADPSKPDGTPRKVMDVSKIHALGWSPKVDLEEGLRKAYQAYEQSEYAIR
jgi:GDP-L-fucose synthase